MRHMIRKHDRDLSPFNLESLNIASKASEADDTQWMQLAVESAQDDRRSISSMPSMTSATTLESLMSAVVMDEVAKLFLEDEVIMNTLSMVKYLDAASARALELETRDLLRTTAGELKITAKRDVERRAMEFLASRAKTITRRLTTGILAEHKHLDLEMVGSDFSGRQIVDRFLLRLRKEGDDPQDGAEGERELPSPENQDELNEESEDKGDPHIEPNDFEKIASFINSSTAMANFRQRLDSIMKVQAEESLHKRLGSCATWQIQQLSPTNVQFLEYEVLTAHDRAKDWLESYSGEPWNWWPFRPPRTLLLDDEVRMQWTCDCGELRSLDIHRSLTEPCQHLLRREEFDGSRAQTDQNDFQNARDKHMATNVCTGDDRATFRTRLERLRMWMSTTKTKAHLTESQPRQNKYARAEAVAKWIRGIFTHLNPAHWRTHAKQLRAQLLELFMQGQSNIIGESRRPVDGVLPTSASRWVLLCLFRGDKIRASQIEIIGATDDDAFFGALRREVRRLRGFWRHYLHLKQFCHCSFGKFTRIYVNRIVKYEYPELPICPRYVYEPRIVLNPRDPHICPHEWYDRYHNCESTGRFCRVVSRLPKRDSHFLFDMHNETEDMWGLHAELRISAAMVLLWMSIIVVGGLIFFVWWIRLHEGDWQNAAVPLTITLMALGTLFVPLNEHFNRPF